MQTFNVHQAKTQLSKLIEKVKQGEEVTISNAGVPVVRLVLYMEPKKKRVAGAWKGKVKMAKDFDQLPEDILNEFYK